MSNDEYVFVITDDESLGMYYCGMVYSQEVWKAHISRAAIFDTKDDAAKEIQLNNLKGVKIIKTEKYW